MKETDIVRILNEDDYHLDELGRMVIDNVDLLQAENGALSDISLLPNTCNIACANSGCCI